jgi:hypothetical protein
MLIAATGGTTVREALELLFALAGGLTLSGIAANCYRILARKPANRTETLIYFAVMSVAGPSVLFNNATRSFRSRDCSTAAYVFAVTVAGYWSFALGLAILAFTMKL